VIISDEVLVKKMFDSLPSSWSVQCMTIKKLHDLKRIGYDEFIGVLEAYELDAKKRDISTKCTDENWVTTALFSNPVSGSSSSGGGGGSGKSENVGGFYFGSSSGSVSNGSQGKSSSAGAS
jgi:uncharacterized membrane protein YgcG